MLWVLPRLEGKNTRVHLYCPRTDKTLLSGKTLAFGVPALTRLLSSSENTLQVLVVAPTRELAIQTHETLELLGKPFNIASVTLMGGVPKDPQIRALKKAKQGKGGMLTRIAVGTPGRILDLANEGTCDLSGLVLC